jgi:tRNA uridine 5-carbamoylmethylation protein Kti12
MNNPYAHYQLVIIIGLPCSGKTTLAADIISSDSIKLFDDLISSFYDGESSDL